MRQRIAVLIPGHMCPIHAADVFTPAQNLPDETLHRGQRRLAVAPSGFGSGDDLLRMQHLYVHGKRKQRMEQTRRVRAHGVLEIAEMGQGIVDECLEKSQGFAAVHRPTESGCRAVPETLNAGAANRLPQY